MSFERVRRWCSRETLSSRPEQIVREAEDLRSGGTCCWHAVYVLPGKSRSLHSPVDRLRQSTDSVGMTECVGSMKEHNYSVYMIASKSRVLYVRHQFEPEKQVPPLAS